MPKKTKQKAKSVSEVIVEKRKAENDGAKEDRVLRKRTQNERESTR